MLHLSSFAASLQYKTGLEEQKGQAADCRCLYWRGLLVKQEVSLSEWGAALERKEPSSTVKQRWGHCAAAQ